MGSDAEYMYENGLDPFYRFDEYSGELVEWEEGLNPLYEDAEEWTKNSPISETPIIIQRSMDDIISFDSYNDAVAFVKKNQEGVITRSQDGVGFIVKYKKLMKSKSFIDIMEGFWTIEDNQELYKRYWIIFKKKWRLLIDYCLNYRNNLEDIGLYQSVNINKTDEISGIASGLINEFMAACKEIDSIKDGYEEITSKLLNLTEDRLQVDSRWRHILKNGRARTEYVFSKRDMKADFIFSEANKESKDKQYSEYLDHHMLYIFTRAIPVDYSGVY